MRKVSLLISVLLLLSLFTMAFAETVIQKPDLPAGYEAWPYTYNGTCEIYQKGSSEKGNLTVSIFAKADPQTKKAEFVSIITTPTPITIVLHGSGTNKQYDFLNSYGETKDGKFVKRDWSDPNDREMTGMSINMLNQFLTRNCPKVDQETTEFFNKLDSLLETK